MSVTPRFVFPGAAQFDLSLFVSERPDEVTCYFEHRTDALPDSQLQSMLEQYRRLLCEAIASPEARISHLLERIGPAR
jgi:hypothetical protein